MPVYLLWGFRWPRQLIRVHVIVQKIDDAAPEWLMSPSSSEAILESFEDLFPAQYAALPHLRLVEQYDPLDEQCKGQPYAYVAARWQRIDLSADVDDTIREAATLEEQRALGELKDALGCKKEKCGWYIVYCGDEIRGFDNYKEDRESSETDEATSDNEKPPHSLLQASNLSAPTAAATSSDSAPASTNNPRLASAKTPENPTTSISNWNSTHVRRGSSQRPVDGSHATDAIQTTRMKDEPEHLEKQKLEKKSSSTQPAKILLDKYLAPRRELKEFNLETSGACENGQRAGTASPAHEKQLTDAHRLLQITNSMPLISVANL